MTCGPSCLIFRASRANRMAALLAAPTAVPVGVLGSLAGTAPETWSEVVALSPDVDTAEFVQPGTTSGNLEPWRPVVDDSEMFAAGCNPGGSEGTQQADGGPR